MSTIAAVLNALATLGAATLPGVQVINGPYGSVTTTDDRFLMVGDDDTETGIVGQRELDTMTGMTTGERYTVPMEVSVSLPGTDLASAVAQALADYTAMEVAIREFPGGPDLGLSASGVLQALPTGQFELKRRTDADGRHAAVRFGVDVIAKNT